MMLKASHVNFYCDGMVGIGRYGRVVRLYRLTEASLRRVCRIVIHWRHSSEDELRALKLFTRAIRPVRRQ